MLHVVEYLQSLLHVVAYIQPEPALHVVVYFQCHLVQFVCLVSRLQWSLHLQCTHTAFLLVLQVGYSGLLLLLPQGNMSKLGEDALDAKPQENDLCGHNCHNLLSVVISS